MREVFSNKRRGASRGTVILALVVIAVLAIGFAYSYQQGYFSPMYLKVFHAGSLKVPFDKVGDAFKSEHPNVRFDFESSGSVDAVRKITDLGKACDILAVADWRLVPKMMYDEYANWTLIFASNEMVVVYTNQSKYANEINPSNWYLVLARKGVVIGRADPDRDPCGYRTLLLFQLASIYYNDTSINETLWNHTETLIKPKSVQLLTGLESGQIDYAFEYRSVAVQHHLNYVELPDELNLSNPKLEAYYARASIMIHKGNETMEIKGAPILYGITIPKNAKNRDLALEFVKFLLGDKGRSIVESYGQNIIYPAYVDRISNVPQELVKMVRPMG